MYPLKLTSVLKDIIWGGTALSEQFFKGEPGQKIAEAWVLACRNDGENIIENGLYKGQPLSVLYPDKDKFPLLIKLIDANDRLSVQVHPDDKYAHEHGIPAGKTEMWYILDAKPGATLVYGMDRNASYTDDDLRCAAKDGSLEKYLNIVEVKQGDVYFIPAGLVHAIGSGILIAEIQQNSNTTYRMYDYNRRDKDGNLRELHIESALEVIDKNPRTQDTKSKTKLSENGIIIDNLCKCNFFNVEKIKIEKNTYKYNGNEMRFFICLEGEGEFVYDNISYKFKKGDGYLMPKELSSYIIKTNNKCELISATE